MIDYKIEVYRHVDKHEYLARFWTVGERISMIATADSEAAVRAKVAKHYFDVEEEITRQVNMREVDTTRRRKVGRSHKKEDG